MTPRINIVSDEEAEQADFLVCMRWTDPPILAKNIRGQCALCKAAIQLDPVSPKKPTRICLQCSGITAGPLPTSFGCGSYD